MANQNKNLTSVGTDIDLVKKLNAASGMSYNEAKAFIAKTTGGHGTNKYSDTNVDEIRKKNQASQQNPTQS